MHVAIVWYRSYRVDKSLMNNWLVVLANILEKNNQIPYHVEHSPHILFRGVSLKSNTKWEESDSGEVDVKPEDVVHLRAGMLEFGIELFWTALEMDEWTNFQMDEWKGRQLTIRWANELPNSRAITPK